MNTNYWVCLHNGAEFEGEWIDAGCCQRGLSGDMATDEEAVAGSWK